MRLELALDRISGAVVRRLEQDAMHLGEATTSGEAGQIGEVRRRLDTLILRLRTVLADIEGGAAG